MPNWLTPTSIPRNYRIIVDKQFPAFDSSPPTYINIVSLMVTAEPEGSRCLMCFMPYKEPDRLALRLRCTHVVCRSCLGKWIRAAEKATCPVCPDADRLSDKFFDLLDTLEAVGWLVKMVYGQTEDRDMAWLAMRAWKREIRKAGAHWDFLAQYPGFMEDANPSWKIRLWRQVPTELFPDEEGKDYYWDAKNLFPKVEETTNPKEGIE
jgi:hypothetical protein